MNESNQRQSNQLEEILDTFSTAMLTTQRLAQDAAGDRGMRARPMRVAGREGHRKIYFVASRHAELVDEIRQSPQVALVFADGSRYLSMSAQALLVEDRALLRSMWSPAMDLWFENGPDDEEVQLVAAVPTRAEYWDMSGTTKIRYAFESIKAFVTGETIEPITDATAHGEIHTPAASL